MSGFDFVCTHGLDYRQRCDDCRAADRSREAELLASAPGLADLVRAHRPDRCLKLSPVLGVGFGASIKLCDHAIGHDGPCSWGAAPSSPEPGEEGP